MQTRAAISFSQIIRGSPDISTPSIEDIIIHIRWARLLRLSGMDMTALKMSLNLVKGLSLSMRDRMEELVRQGLGGIMETGRVRMQDISIFIPS